MSVEQSTMNMLRLFFLDSIYLYKKITFKILISCYVVNIKDVIIYINVTESDVFKSKALLNGSFHYDHFN